ncbi:MAG: gliding motility-associated C-terminal domain-containing protein [Bacteroidales bacterium]|nr:gliding motility-associated C-terminal domain-containing protein [Bacteroidales bacterium]
MGKLKVFIFILFLVISTNIIAQTNIDSVDFIVDFPESYLKAHVSSGYFEGAINEKFELADTANYEFTWSGDLTPGIDSLHAAIYDFSIEGNYLVSLSVLEKSTTTAFSFSRVVSIAAPVILDVPNVFTPNGDGQNDLFEVFYNGTTNLEISIFTRNGTLVFDAVSPSIVWDGRNSSGSELSEGVYFYIIKSAVLSKEKKGFVYLYRSDINQD